MTDFIGFLFGDTSFVPHGYCLLWRPDLVAMHVVSDAVIAVSYLSIPLGIAVFVRHRSDLYYKKIFWLFAAFIVACGVTHIFDIFTLWSPAYGAQGLVKACTAVISALTAIQLWPVIPQALALPSPSLLRKANEALEGRNRENERINAELTAIRDELEARVHERTAALAEANRRLTEREAYFRSLYRATPIMMHSLDRDGRVIEINDAWASRMGYSRDEVIGQPSLNFVAAEQHKQVKDEYSDEFWQKGSCDRLRHTLVRKDGSSFETEISAITHADGAELQAFAVVVDVAEREAAEAGLRKKARELERANERLTQFSYVASHDLQEPLRKIVAFSDVLGGALAKNNVEDMRYAASVMQEAALRARQLVGDLLAFSRSANAELHILPHALADVVDVVLHDLSVAIKEAKAEVTVDVDGVVVEADRSQLVHLIENLVSNAIKYRKPDAPPSVTVTARHLPDQGTEIAVEDSGIGFDAAYAALIFEPFKRLHTRADYPGSGIGLAICRTISDRHGWSISATSECGKGSRFAVLLPRYIGTISYDYQLPNSNIGETVRPLLNA